MIFLGVSEKKTIFHFDENFPARVGTQKIFVKKVTKFFLSRKHDFWAFQKNFFFLLF